MLYNAAMDKQVVKLHPAQYKVFKDPERFKVVVAGRRFGKSLLSRAWIMNQATRVPGTYWIVSPTYGMGKDIHWKQGFLAEIELKRMKSKNEQDLEFVIDVWDNEGKKIIGESRIGLRSADNPDRLRGVKLRALVIDEIAQMTNWSSLWAEALRPTLTDYQAPALFISSPAGFNHFYDLYQKGMPGHEGYNPDYKSYHFTSYDNPYNKPEELESARKEVGEITFEQEYLAKFTKNVGAVYSEWDAAKQFVEVDYDPRLPLHVSFDFGVNDPTAVVWIQPFGGEMRIIDYYEAVDASVDHFVQVLNSKPYKRVSLCTGDPAGAARSIVTGTSPLDEYRKHGYFIRTKGGVRIPDQIRITHKYIPSLYVSNKLDRFRDCLINYSYPRRKSGLIYQSNEQPVHDEYSHAMRALEYYFVNIDTNLTQATGTNLNRMFPEQKLFDSYGSPNF